MKRSHRFDGKKLGMLRTAREFLFSLAVVFLVFRFVVGVSLVSGMSMDPTLKSGTLVVYFRLAKTFERGDVVSVRMPNGEYYVKRIIAVAGDTVALEDGKVLVNGAPEQQSGAHGETLPEPGEVVYPLTVPFGAVFVLGDNREVSVDSRTYGTVATSQIRGKLLFVD